jgi:hypothetical protein
MAKQQCRNNFGIGGKGVALGRKPLNRGKTNRIQ